MEPAARYEIVDKIASGDFATVYRARDRELGREVAIKQVHPQFLADQRQLARYWQEAQLLASLQHPNIVTIYDITRSRGWLILELMRGSLKQTAQAAQGEQIDLDFLRVVLTDSLAALHFLHQNGVIHGDVKPSNLLVDARNRVKLGDFGLARRASNEEGSLLKGTTKYMAPELINPQFGAVGPGSDLYSLGFTAYELICGSQFESLFPGLGSFGRDRQIAWMMWHAAADRNLPEISKVLENVPADLAHAVQKMIVKDPARRYQSAAEVLHDLRPDPRLAGGLGEEADLAAEAARIAAAKRKRRLRYLGVLSAACLGALALVLYLNWPKAPPAPGPPAPIHGVVLKVMPEWNPPAMNISTLDDKGQEIPREIDFLDPQHDRVIINGKISSPGDLQPHDAVEIEKKEIVEGVGAAKRKLTFLEVRASRPEMDKGRIQSIQADEGTFTLAVDDEGGDGGANGKTRNKKLRIIVPRELRIVFNGAGDFRGKPVELKDLQKGDRVVVHHAPDDKGRHATELEVQRRVTTEGILRDVTFGRNAPVKLKVARDGADSDLIELPLADGCRIILNGEAKTAEQRILKPTDLKPGDQVTLTHDVRVVVIDARRVLGQGGVIQAVAGSAEGTINVLHQGAKASTRYHVGPGCKITLGDESVTLGDLRVGDAVDVKHDRESDTGNLEALAISARRPADPTRWAIVVGTQDYEDKTLAPLDYPVSDATLLAGVLVRRYRVPADQVVMLVDESLVRLEQGIPERLAKLGADAKLIVYVAGHAYKDEQGVVYLAPKNFDRKRPSLAGLSLQWLVDQMEQCPAKEKLLLLDCCQDTKGADAAAEPSTAEMLGSLKSSPGRSPFHTVTAVVSCMAGQRGHAWPAKNHGLFAWCLAEAYRGNAEADRDGRVEPAALYEFLKKTMAAASSGLKIAQTPQLFLPDARPPRLSEEAKDSIRKLAALLRSTKIDLTAAEEEFNTAKDLAGKEIEPSILYGLLLIKAKDHEAALKHLEELKIKKPASLFPSQGTAWVRFEKRSYTPGVNDLLELVAKIPKPKKPGDPCPPQLQQLFSWIGQLREFAATAEEPTYRPPAELLANLDAAVTDHGSDADRFYQQGRDHSRDIVIDYENKLANSQARDDISRLKVDRRQLVHYAAFPQEKFAKEVLAGLDQE